MYPAAPDSTIALTAAMYVKNVSATMVVLTFFVIDPKRTFFERTLHKSIIDPKRTFEERTLHKSIIDPKLAKSAASRQVCAA